MNKHIEKPRVFISYSWGSDDHQEKVLAFATSLRMDGVDVILDKWDLTEGNDMNAFMEKCVNDPSVTNVLMLLDSNYAQKANDRTGGVGTETQIISAVVYQSADQDKFIPIVFERDRNGNVCKPTYLQHRLHFDLSLPEKYQDNYTRLVRKLYGVETYKKPELGSKPDWVDNQIVVEPQKMAEYSLLQVDNPSMIKKEMFDNYLLAISEDICRLSKEINESSDADYISSYDRTRMIRDSFLGLLSKSYYVDDYVDHISSFFEDTFNKLDNNNSKGSSICMILLHELFIYTVAGFVKRKDYTSTGALLGRTYFNQHSYSDSNQATNFNMFYSGTRHSELDNAVKKKDNKKYHSGTANYWIVNLNNSFCSKEDFVEADLICYNYSIYGDGYSDNWKWFPITYVYDNEYNSRIKLFAKKLASKYQLQKVLALFNYANIDEFKTKFKEINELINSGSLREYRYPSSFNSAPALGYFIKPEELGSLR